MRLTWALLALVVLGCGGGDDFVIEVGIIEHHIDADGQVIQVPDSVEPGWPVTVVVRTYGDNCISPERLEVEQSADSIVFTPYDRRHIPGENSGCVSTLFSYFHETTITFTTLGPQELIVQGRRINQGEGSDLVEHSVVVQVE